MMTKSIDRKSILSTLWIFVMFNYLYADLSITIFLPGMYQKIAAEMSGAILLVATGLMEVLIAMIFLARILPYKANRLANMISGAIGTLFVAITLNRSSPVFYILLATIEMAATLFIIWYSWTWRDVDERT